MITTTNNNNHNHNNDNNSNDDDNDNDNNSNNVMLMRGPPSRTCWMRTRSRLPEQTGTGGIGVCR